MASKCSSSIWLRKAGAQIVVIATKIQPPVGEALAETSDSAPGTERHDPGQASPLPILDDRNAASAPPPDRPVRERSEVSTQLGIC